MRFLAGLLTGLAVNVALAQSGGAGVSMMNHVGINVPNIPDAVKYYTGKANSGISSVGDAFDRAKSAFNDAFRGRDEPPAPPSDAPPSA